MYAITEQTAEELKARSLIRVSERIEERTRFFGPREKLMVDFEGRGPLPLSEGYAYRIVYSNNARRKGPMRPIIYFELSGFDDRHYGTSEAVVWGLWGPEYMAREAKGNVTYQGGLELLSPGLVRDTIALLDHRGGVDLEPAPWDED